MTPFHHFFDIRVALVPWQVVPCQVSWGKLSYTSINSPQSQKPIIRKHYNLIAIKVTIVNGMESTHDLMDCWEKGVSVKAKCPFNLSLPI